MQIIAAATALFATAAMAAPQWTPWNPGWNPNPNPNQGYRQTCTCQVNGQIMPWLGQQACGSLGNIWPNLQSDWNGNCYDLAGVGLEPNGFEAACQRVAGQPGWQPGWWGQGGNNNPFNPQAIRGICSPF